MTDDDWQLAYHRGMAVSHWATVAPDRVAMVWSGGERTYAQLNGRVNQIVRTLRAAGLEVGAGVAVMLGNRPEFLELYLACQRAGWRFTPINWHLTPGEAAYIVEDCDAGAFVADAVIEDAIGTTKLVAPEAGAGRRVCWSVGGPLDGCVELDRAIAGADPSDIDDPVRGTPMLYTSGTTGKPKGVRRDEPAPAVLEPAIYPEGSVYLCTGPTYHAAPLAITCHPALMRGGTLVIMEQWDPVEALRLIEQHRVSHTHLVPTMFHRLLALPEEERASYDLSSLLIVVHGAAPCPIPVKQAMIEWFGPVIYEYYAATEGAGTLVDSATWLARPGTVGRPTPRGQVIVGDDDATPLPAGEIGTVWLRVPAGGEGRFRYHGDEEKTSAAYRGDYFTLNDLGYTDDDGYLYLTDRSANLIISGGVNIYPAEVDAVLLEHPAVADAATIGVPDDEWGESVKAVVQLRDDAEASDALADELIALCRDRLASFKCPRSVDFVPDLPRHDTGKIYKRLLREQYRA